jgi:opine dehydrogenase
MNHKMKIAVLGSGHGGRAISCQIAAKDYPVAMYKIRKDEPEEFRRLKAEKKIILQGNIQTRARIDCITTDLQEAVTGAGAIIPVLPSFVHEALFQKLIPLLEDGQHVIIVPGNYGGLLLKKMMADMGIKREITISETVSLPYACRISAYNTVRIYKQKAHLKITASPSQNIAAVVDLMNDIFGGFVNYFPGANLIEASLDNLNQTVHPLPVLLNYGDIEKNPKTFRHYIDGFTPLISELMMRMDEERLAIGKAFGLDLMPVLEQWKMYYGKNDTATYYEFVNSDDSPYHDVVGHHVKSRYITEDVPGLNVPALQLAHRVGLDVPITDLVVRLASCLHDVDYNAKGTTLEKLGIANLKPEEIVALAS